MTELLVRVPLPTAEVWAEMQAQVEEVAGQAEGYCKIWLNAGSIVNLAALYLHLFAEHTFHTRPEQTAEEDEET